MKKRVRSDSRAEDEVYHAIADRAVEMINSIDAIDVMQSSSAPCFHGRCVVVLTPSRPVVTLSLH